MLQKVYVSHNLLTGEGANSRLLEGGCFSVQASIPSQMCLGRVQHVTHPANTVTSHGPRSRDEAIKAVPHTVVVSRHTLVGMSSVWHGVLSVFFTVSNAF